MSNSASVTEDNPVVPTTVSLADNPHMQPLAKDPRRTEALVGLILLIGLIGFVFFGCAYWFNLSEEWEGVGLGVGLFFFGFGISAWAKYLLPQGPFSEERHSHASTEAEVDSMSAALVERSTLIFHRRKFLGGLLALGGGVMGLVMMFPLIRSLGSLPKKTFDTTDWKSGSVLVDEDGRRVTVDTLEPGGSVVVFPKGGANPAIDQVFLIRPGLVDPDTGIAPDMVTAPGRETWGPNGYLAFSKVCTHAGCPVGLYQEQTQQMLCPCHQSLFNVGPPSSPKPGINAQPAVPVFGPAPRPLPQLPLAVARDGKTLIAQGPFSEPVGPGFWERS